MARTPHLRYVRYRDYNRQRYNRRVAPWLEAEATRLGLTPRQIWDELLVRLRMSAEQVSGLDESPIEVPPENWKAPTISGTPVAGTQLTANDGSWAGFPTPTFAYQWNRDGEAISGATNATYTLVAADVGELITVTITATNAEGEAEATSAPLGPVQGVAPASTAAPVLSGTPTVGQELSVTAGTWTGIPTPTYAYVWMRDGEPIDPAETGTTYTLVEADVDAEITVVVTATNVAGSAEATSNALGPVEAE